jgi:hypothetical protein
MIGQSIPYLRFPSSKKWECEFKEIWEINQLKSWRGKENRENIEVGIYRMGISMSTNSSHRAKFQ